ncbi:unnamed protein product [Urochloa humidicola]
MLTPVFSAFEGFAGRRGLAALWDAGGLVLCVGSRHTLSGAIGSEVFQRTPWLLLRCFSDFLSMSRESSYCCHPTRTCLSRSVALHSLPRLDLFHFPGMKNVAQSTFCSSPK